MKERLPVADSLYHLRENLLYTFLHIGMYYTFKETIISLYSLFVFTHKKKNSREEENKNLSLAAFRISHYTQKITNHP